jgi:endonuclease/exonuclease/phosphatase (EEP) superfamily protein YafD
MFRATTSTRRRTGRSAALAVLTLTMLVGALGPSSSSATGATRTSTLPTGTVRVAHANLQFKMSSASFAADLATVVSGRPDLVSLNEVSRRTDAQLTPRGYAEWMPREKGNGNAVLWRTDRWSRTDGGYTVLTDSGPLKYDKWRLATWATLHSSTGDLSMISTHQMQNPAKFGPDKPLRQRIYRQAMTRLSALVTELSARGPVFVAGDFNSQFHSNDPWGPRRTLASTGLAAAMEKLGATPTHDAGGTIDYVFYPTATALPTAQKVTNLRSDHKLLQDDFRFLDAARGR